MKKIFFIITVILAVISLPIIVFGDEYGEPCTAVLTEQYSDYAVCTVNFSNIPPGSSVIVSKYKDNKFINAEVIDYRGESESFTVYPDTDTVKIFVLKSRAGLSPVTKTEVIKPEFSQDSPTPELDEKINNVSKELKNGKNKNVTIYRTEENEPRAVIWTKGITPPQMSDFEKEVDGAYSYLYVSPGKGRGWYDVNKSYFQEDGSDRNMCYAAVSANQLHWWLDQNKNNIDKYIEKLEKSGSSNMNEEKINQLKYLRSSYNSQTDSGIYTMFKNYFQSLSGCNADVLNDFFINGYEVNALGKVNDPYFFTWDLRGGFFFDVFGTTILTKRWGAGNYDAFERDTRRLFKEGEAVSIIYTSPSANITHIVSVWGAEFDCNNRLTAVYITDSDDQEQPYIGMKRMRINKDASGYPRITSRTDDLQSGALITELVPLSQGDEMWESYLGA